MAKDTQRPTNAKKRRDRLVVQKSHARIDSVFAVFSRHPNAGYGVLISSVFVLLTVIAVGWAREQSMLAPGRLAPSSINARVAFEMTDRAATENARLSSRQTAPNVYVANTSRLESLEASIVALPSTLATAQSPEDVEAGIRDSYGLTPERLKAIQAAFDEESAAPSANWQRASQKLARNLEALPLVDSQTFQLEENSPRKRAEVLVGDRRTTIPSTAIISVGNAARLRTELERAVSLSGFFGPPADAIIQHLLDNPEPTFRLDDALSSENRALAASRVQPVIVTTPAGASILTRGTPVTQAALDALAVERRAHRAQATTWTLWLPRLSLAGGAVAVAIAAAGYIGLFNQRIRRNPDRMLGIALLMLAGLYLTVGMTAAAPQLWGLTAFGPTLLVTAILAIAYDQRTAIALGSLQALLIALALEHPIGAFATMLTGVGTLVVMLGEIRDRRTIMRAGLTVSVILTITTICVAGIDRPATTESLVQTLYDALLAGLGGLVTATITLGALSSVERAFDITTGMTLIELRDPKQPLLRELQQRAPGSYNHSLNVASIAETAADAIGADSLLTYVGALYHDIGKMNKPEYFVENQGQASNKHDSLSPAMSLLLIVGHVKDGIELAREFNLPRTLHHFIEAHHGTTLVEYFYHRAIKEAESDIVMGDDAQTPAEFDYRYPGPKPHTKEVAILMIADAVESATRTLAEPTASRIENLVQNIARKRLDDGQFDECGLTLKELRTVMDSMTKSLTAIYHGRVAYPTDAPSVASQKTQPA